MLISIFNFLVCAALIGILIYFHPNKNTAKKFNFIQETISFCGDFENGFEPIKDFHKENFKITRYYPADKIADKNILFIPPKTSSVETYDLFLSKLANDGFNVFAAEFYTTDVSFFKYKILSRKILRQSVFRYFWKKNPEFFKQTQIANKQYFKNELRVLLDYSKKYSSQNNLRYVIADNDINSVMEDFMAENIYDINGVFDLATIKTYTTPGLGPVENTNPETALRLRIIPDKTNYMSMHLASSVEKKFIPQH